MSRCKRLSPAHLRIPCYHQGSRPGTVPAPARGCCWLLSRSPASDTRSHGLAMQRRLVYILCMSKPGNGKQEALIRWACGCLGALLTVQMSTYLQAVHHIPAAQLAVPGDNCQQASKTAAIT